jgi:ATP-binding cassette, subfamily B, bacterial
MLYGLPITHYRSLLSAYLRPQRGRVTLLAALLFGSIALQLVNPQIVRFFIDTTQSGGSQGALVAAAVLFIAIGLTQRAVALGAMYTGENVAWTATNGLRSDLARHVIGLDMSFHKQRTPGELIERIDNDVDELANFFSQLVLQVLGNALLVLGVLALLFREDWRIGVGLSLYAVLVFVILGAIQNLAVRRYDAERQAAADQFGFIEERITGTEDVRANGGEAYVMRRLFVLLRRALRAQRSANVLSSATEFTTNALAVLGYVVGLALGVYLYTEGAVSLGAAYIVVFYVGMLSAPLQSLREQVQNLQQATASIGRVQTLFGIRPKVVERRTATLPSGALAVEFQNVSFAYDDEQHSPDEPPATPTAVLHDVSFRLEPGQVLGILGRTGSGKTSLTRLLFRLYDPTEGTIRVGDADLRDLPTSDLRARVGMVTQDVQLFYASIRDNLTFFNPRIGDDQIRRVLEQLDLLSWVESLPSGLDTTVTSATLSAGEAQLLAFARVFLRDPGVVVLDEASSRLDPATERVMERAVDELLHPAGRSRTGIIIAHRLQTVGRADLILILEAGRVVEFGPRATLASDPRSRFYHLLQTGLEEILV